MSRRFEYSADSFAVTITGDPEAMITSLIKLARLNLLPMSWARFDEGLFTHPSTIRRIHAVARRCGIPDYRIDQLLNAPDSAEDHYSLTDTATVPVSTPPIGYPVPGHPAPVPGYMAPPPGYVPATSAYGTPPPGRVEHAPAYGLPPETYAPSPPGYATPSVNPARRPFRKKSLKVLIPLRYAPFTATASLLLFMPGTQAATILDSLAIPRYAVALLVGILTVAMESTRLKRKLLKHHPKSLEFHPTSPDAFIHLDTAALATYTAELEKLGFQRVQDYTHKSDPPSQLQGFARLFLHPSHSCTAEVSQVVASNRAAVKMGCTIATRLDDGWSCWVSDREPNAYIYVKRNPKKVFRWLPGSSVPLLLENHLRTRDEITSQLGVKVLSQTLE
ncbi:MAG: M48 family metalloprotease, partial [Blastocatellia bacterium]